jgi:hypothetical protein
MNASDQQSIARAPPRARRSLPTVFEARTMVAAEDLPARFERRPESGACAFETIAGRVYMRGAAPSADEAAASEV